MSTETPLTIHQLHMVGIDDLRKRSGLIIGLGILLILIGLVALGSAVTATLASMVFFGWLMIMTGVLQTAHGFMVRAWGGFFLEVMAGIFYSVTGFLIIAHPGATAVALTLMIAILLIVGGIFRIVIALTAQFPNRPWLFLHGVINLLLATAILQEWPVSGLWVIGTFIGIDMIFNGWTLVMLGVAARRLSTPA